MAKKSSRVKNERRIRLVAQYGEKRAELKKLVIDESLSFEDRMEAQRRLQKLPRNSSPVRVRNRCALTGRPRGYMGLFKLSRIKFREMALLGYLPGVKKTSW
jgi:small subunit ribosomal protein S14